MKARLDDSMLWKFKIRLQYTGWLQYVPAATIGVLFCIIAVFGRIAGVGVVLWIALAVGADLPLRFGYEIVTMKFGLGPAEPVPGSLDEFDPFDLMRMRRSCRAFQSRAHTPSHLSEILESAGAHSRTSVLIGDRPIRFEYVKAH